MFRKHPEKDTKPQKDPTSLLREQYRIAKEQLFDSVEWVSLTGEISSSSRTILRENPNTNINDHCIIYTGMSNAPEIKRYIDNICKDTPTAQNVINRICTNFGMTTNISRRLYPLLYSIKNQPNVDTEGARRYFSLRGEDGDNNDESAHNFPITIYVPFAPQEYFNEYRYRREERLKGSWSAALNTVTYHLPYPYDTSRRSHMRDSLRGVVKEYNTYGNVGDYDEGPDSLGKYYL